jgi:hypothetical protein
MYLNSLNDVPIRVKCIDQTGCSLGQLRFSDILPAEVGPFLRPKFVSSHEG